MFASQIVASLPVQCNYLTATYDTLVWPPRGADSSTRLQRLMCLWHHVCWPVMPVCWWCHAICDLGNDNLEEGSPALSVAQVQRGGQGIGIALMTELVSMVHQIFPMIHPVNAPCLLASNNRSIMTIPSHLASSWRSRVCHFNKHPSPRQADSLETRPRIHVMYKDTRQYRS